MAGIVEIARNVVVVEMRLKQGLARATRFVCASVDFFFES